MRIQWRCFGGASKSYTPRLRHAMFRFNWPTSELMMGQYWSMFCEYYAESVEDGPLQMTGTPTARLAQVRFTQKFPERLDRGRPARQPEPGFCFMVIPGPRGFLLIPTINNGQSAETPQVQGKIQYAHDFSGPGGLLRQAHPLHGPGRRRLAAQCPAEAGYVLMLPRFFHLTEWSSPMQEMSI